MGHMTGIKWQRELIRYKRGAISIMVGRPRKQGYRTACGALARTIVRSEDKPMREIDHFLDDPTVIYVTEAGPMSKIGFTKNPKQRSKELQTSNGHVVRMVWYRWMHGSDARRLEKAVHKQYQNSNYHAHGEWYYFDTETAIGIIARKIYEMGLYSIWEKWSAYVERPLDDPGKDNLPNPFTGGHT